MRLVTLAMFVLSACGLDSTDSVPAPVDPGHAVLVGDIPGLERLQDEASYVRVVPAPENTQVTVVVETARGAGMAQLDIDPSTIDSGAPAVALLACSGPKAFEWDYDQAAHSVATYSERNGDLVTMWFRGDVRDFRGHPKPDSDEWVELTPAELAAIPVRTIEGRVTFRAP